MQEAKLYCIVTSGVGLHMYAAAFSFPTGRGKGKRKTQNKMKYYAVYIICRIDGAFLLFAHCETTYLQHTYLLVPEFFQETRADIAAYWIWTTKGEECAGVAAFLQAGALRSLFCNLGFFLFNFLLGIVRRVSSGPKLSSLFLSQRHLPKWEGLCGTWCIELHPIST